MLKKHLNLLLLTALLLSSCALPGRGAPADAVPAAETPVAEIATPTPEPPTATPEPPPTEEPTPEPSPTPAAVQAIIGQVFHDVCAHTDPEDEGCQTASDGRRAGNGILDETDLPLAGVRVSLGAGLCPATGLAETFSNAEGQFAFAELLPGDYCVSIDPADNADLEPGLFTLPQGGQASLRLTTDELVAELNFGWDYERLPLVVKDCTDSLALVAAPASTTVSGGAAFTQRWQVENTGSCTWTEEYALVHVAGEALGETTELALTETVRPGNTLELELALTSPAEAGSYTGDWLLRNEHGDTFGTGDEETPALTVEITVLGELIMAATLGEPDYRDTLGNDDRWNLFEDDHVQMVWEEGRIRLTSKETIGYDSWTVTAGTLGNATIEAVFTTGPACDGYDRYGLIVRSETINEGYFFGISCNGNYVVREWNGRRWQLISGWAPGKGINTGPDQVNHLVVVMEGNRFEFYVNGQLQVIAQDPSQPFYGGGRFGPFVAGQQTSNFTVYLEDIAAWSP